MGSKVARQILYIEKDGEFPEHMVHVGGSCALVTINGLLSIVTARHCITQHIELYPGSPKHCLATFRTVGDPRNFALFKDLYFVDIRPSSNGVVGEECDLAICKSMPAERYRTKDAFPLVNGDKSGYDPDLKPGDQLFCYGFPDFCGPYLVDKSINYNPCMLWLRMVELYNDGMNGIAEIEMIRDKSGKTYPNDTNLNGLSGGPLFRYRENGEVFSGIALMHGDGKLRFLASRKIIEFARQISKS